MTISLKELIDFGYLQEVNRIFFHPLGLALQVSVDSKDPDANNDAIAWGVYDGRSDDEGMNLVELDLEKAKRVSDEVERRKPIREKALGYWEQPINK